jgi:hypothetical protein
MRTETNYVTGKAALSNSMVSLLEYLAAHQHGVRYLNGINVKAQYTWFKENRISSRTWKALEDRGLIESPGYAVVIQHGSNMAVLTAEGVRALLQFGIPAELRQAILDDAHGDAVIEGLERQVGATTYAKCGCLLNSANAHRVGCTRLADPAVAKIVDAVVVAERESAARQRTEALQKAAVALADEDPAEATRAWGRQPQHAVQAVHAQRVAFGSEIYLPHLLCVRDPASGAYVRLIAVDEAVRLGLLIQTERPDGFTYRVAPEVLTAATVELGRTSEPPCNVIDSRVLANATTGTVARVTLGSDQGGIVTVAETIRLGVGPIRSSLERHEVLFDGRYYLTKRVNGLIQDGFTQTFRRTGDGQS